MVGQDKVGGRDRGRATRAGILEVGRRLLSVYGFHATSLADIQAATGLTKGAFYHHFSGKEDLALAVLEAAREDYEREWLAPAKSGQSAVGRLTAMLDAEVRLNARPEWRNCILMATMSAELTEADGPLWSALRAWRTEWVGRWAAVIAEAQQTGEVHAALQPLLVAEWVVSTLTGAALARKLGAAGADLGKFVELMSRTMLGRVADEREPSSTIR